MELRFRHGEHEIVLDVTPDGGGWRVRLADGGECTIQAERASEHELRIQAGDRIYRAPFLRTGGGLEIGWRGQTYRFAEGGLRVDADSAAHASGRLVSPMTGVIVQVHVGVGDAVAAYQPLLTVEAMKVLVTVEAQFDGVLSALHVGKGDRVEMGAVVAEVTPVEQTA